MGQDVPLLLDGMASGRSRKSRGEWDGKGYRGKEGWGYASELGVERGGGNLTSLGIRSLATAPLLLSSCPSDSASGGKDQVGEGIATPVAPVTATTALFVNPASIFGCFWFGTDT